ncbi:MAG: Sulfite exporter TauE/SafE [Chthoniobacter sp.]|jgi:uncharacterized membrane protein YfcA|nr:Sulfite exporter TauE/SafE [Chthoniobacter sp.]
MLPNFDVASWLLAATAAFCIGFSKSGFAGSGLLTVLIMAKLFEARESTGVLLPMLICGDVLSVLVFHQHAQWKIIWRMLPPTIFGIVAGFILMHRLSEPAFRPVIGWIVLIMVVVQSVRRWRPALFEQVPRSTSFAWTMGTASGLTTMLANAAGPVMALYFLAIRLPKYELVGTSAWFFLLINLFKVPFSVNLGLIHSSSLALNFVLIPAIAFGIFSGQRLIRIIPQSLFEAFLLIFATVSSLRLIGAF